MHEPNVYDDVDECDNGHDDTSADLDIACCVVERDDPSVDDGEVEQ